MIKRRYIDNDYNIAYLLICQNKILVCDATEPLKLHNVTTDNIPVGIKYFPNYAQYESDQFGHRNLRNVVTLFQWFFFLL